MPETPEQIARKLTEAQRSAILNMAYTDAVWDALADLGLMRWDRTTLTTLGLAVRNALTKDQAHGR